MLQLISVILQEFGCFTGMEIIIIIIRLNCSHMQVTENNAAPVWLCCGPTWMNRQVNTIHSDW